MAVEFCDERKSNKQDLSGLNAFPDVLPVSSCDDRRLLIEENMNLFCNHFPIEDNHFTFTLKICQCSLLLLDSLHITEQNQILTAHLCLRTAIIFMLSWTQFIEGTFGSGVLCLIKNNQGVGGEQWCVRLTLVGKGYVAIFCIIYYCSCSLTHSQGGRAQPKTFSNKYPYTFQSIQYSALPTSTFGTDAEDFWWE